MTHAELSIAKKDFSGALADVDRVIAKRPDAPLAWEMRATANVAKPDFPAARADVDRALRLDPKARSRCACAASCATTPATTPARWPTTRPPMRSRRGPTTRS